MEELFIEERLGYCLALNPVGPSWASISSTSAAVLLAAERGKPIEATARDVLENESAVTDALTSIEKLATSGFFRTGDRMAILPLSNVAFNITKRCNLECGFCYYDSGPSAGHDLDELTAEGWCDIASEVAAINPLAKVYIMGGEPYLRRDLSEIVAGTLAAGLTVEIVTNGMWIDDAAIRWMKGFRERFTVQISIDSLDPEENSATRGPRHLPRALRGLDRCIDAGVDVKVSATLTTRNPRGLAQLRDRCSDSAVPFRVSTFFVGGERSSEYQFGHTPASLWELIQEPINAGDTISGEAQHQLKAGRPRYGCGVGYGTVSFDPEGRVSPCNHLTDQTIGYSDREPLWEVIKRGYRQFHGIDVEFMPKDGCGGCHLRNVCGGGCKASSYHAYERFDTPPPDCSFLKRVHLESLWKDLMGDGAPAPSSRGFIFSRSGSTQPEAGSSIVPETMPITHQAAPVNLRRRDGTLV